jgi:hypothetical protein
MTARVNSGVGDLQVFLADLDPDRAAALKRRWSASRSALSAVSAYADALREIVAAGNTGAEAADAFADAFGGLVSAAGGAAISPMAISAFKELNAYVARIRAHHALADAITAAQPAVDTVAAILAADLDELAGLAESAGLEKERALLQESRNVVNYVEGLEREDDRVLEILTLFLDLDAGRLDALTILCQKDTQLVEVARLAGQARAKGLEARREYWTGRSRSIQFEVARYERRYADYRRQTEFTRNERARIGDALNSARRSVLAWGRAHRRIAEALLTRKTLTITEFSGTVTDQPAEGHREND